MGEVRNRDRIRVREEEDMNKAEQERRDVGLSPEEVREVNEPKTERQRNRRTEKLVNVLAASLTAAAGVGLAGTVQEALKNAPSAVVQEQKPDPKRDNPPEGVVFPENTRADAPVEPFLRKRVFIPRVLKEVSQEQLDKAERPLWPQEFGAPERGVILFNRGVERGVKLGDPQLFENLMYFREKYGRPDLKLKITFYDSSGQINRLSGISPYDSSFKTIIYDFWGTQQVPIFDEQGNYVESRTYPPTFATYGEQRFRLRDGNTLEFHISLPVLRQGGTDPAPEQIRSLSIKLTQENLWRIFISHETGKPSTTDKPLDNTDIENYWPTKSGRSAFIIVM